MIMHWLHCFVYFVPYFDMLVDLKCRWVTIFMRWFWFVILHSIFVMKFWYSSLIHFGISLYVFILIRKLYHKVHFDKCKCTMWSLIKNCLDLLLLMCSLLLFDIVKGGEIWMHKLKMIKTHYGINSRGASLFDD